MLKRMTADLPPLPAELPPAPHAGQAANDEPQIASAMRPIEVGPIVGLTLRSLRCGCYLVNYTPKAGLLTTFDGTIRVECHSNGRTASGDLYQRNVIFLPSASGTAVFSPSLPSRPILAAPPNPGSGIPVFARNRYRYYLRVTQLLESLTFSSSFTLGFEMYRFTAPNTWVHEGAFKAVMNWKPAPAGFPSASDYLEGDVKNSAGNIVGRLAIGWVSKYLRKAVVEIDRVSASEAPMDNGAGLNWAGVFDKVGWQISVDVSDANVSEASGAGWSDAEMHSGMLARRNATNLDTEWRYHVLAVKTIDSTPRGIMYDIGATDSNKVAREGIGISSHWVIPNESPWGTVKGERFGTSKAAYFRTAIHEVGHAMGLYHTTGDNGFMNTTDVIAASCPATFPGCIKWDFHPDNQKQLRHYPDVFVRPGGAQFGQASTSAPPIAPTDLDVQPAGLTLAVRPVMAAVPLGAPVRVNVELKNEGAMPVFAPSSLNLKNGLLSGTVIDPGGAVRSFLPLFGCVDELPIAELAPGASVSNSLTILRGAQGALFPMAGIYRIQVLVSWDVHGVESTVLGETSMMVTGAVDDRHAEAALRVLSTPDTLLAVVLGGDHLDEGISAIQAALDNPVLRPHYAYIEAKRVSQPSGKRAADPEKAAKLLTGEVVMSPAEQKKAATMGKAAAAKGSK